jgi:CrcB protein
VILAIAVGVAASLGAILRYGLDEVISRRSGTPVPLGTMVVNISGSFVLGLVTGLAAHHGLPSRTATICGAGLCGGFTTWSTYCWESLALARDRALGAMAFTLGASLALCLAAAAAGSALALV